MIPQGFITPYSSLINLKAFKKWVNKVASYFMFLHGTPVKLIQPQGLLIYFTQNMKVYKKLKISLVNSNLFILIKRKTTLSSILIIMTLQPVQKAHDPSGQSAHMVTV